MGGFSYTAAVNWAYLITLVFHFSMNRIFTFENATNKLGSQVIRYGCLSLMNYGVTLAVVSLTVEIFKQSPALGMFLAIFASVIIGYPASKYWVFRAEKIGTPHI